MPVDRVFALCLIHYDSRLVSRTVRVVRSGRTLECGECDGVVSEELACRCERVLYRFTCAASFPGVQEFDQFQLQRLLQVKVCKSVRFGIPITKINLILTRN